MDFPELWKQLVQTSPQMAEWYRFKWEDFFLNNYQTTFPLWHEQTGQFLNQPAKQKLENWISATPLPEKPFVSELVHRLENAVQSAPTKKTIRNAQRH